MAARSARGLTSYPRSVYVRHGKDEDSFCKMATFRRENVHCCIDVAIMMRATFRAGPFSYFPTFPALRPVRLLQQQQVGVKYRSSSTAGAARD